MIPLVSSVSETTIWSVTLEPSTTILEASFTLIYNVYSTGVTHDDRNMFIVQATGIVGVGLFKTLWKRIRCKQRARWQHLNQLKASAFFSL